jgi:hypothetical protein
MKAILFALSMLAAIATDALANRCPMEMAKIDAALKTAQLSPDQKSEVEKLRKQGEELHNAGNHPASEAALDKAKDILKIK